MNQEPTLPREKHMEKGLSLFDEHGRLIPAATARVYGKVSRRYFNLLQPQLNYSRIHGNIQKHLQMANIISAADFESISKRLLETLRKDVRAKDLLNGVHVPFFCPVSTQNGDYGQELDDVYLKAVGSAFKERFPEYSFTNYCAGQLAGQIAVDSGSRHERFLDSRKQGAVVGWYFPNCLSEYAVPDQRALISSLPIPLLLSGGFDAAAAFIGSPDLLMKTDNNYPHLLCLSALTPNAGPFFYHFETYGWNLTFNRRSYIGAVSEYWAGGLTVIA